MSHRVGDMKGIGIHLDKLRTENMVRVLVTRARPPGSLYSCFSTLLESARDVKDPRKREENISALCIVALELGFREFALRHKPRITSIDEGTLAGLVEAAKSVSQTSADVDLISPLSTVPLTSHGRLHKRSGQLLRIDFSDGKKAYCKTRNAMQEEVGFELLKTVGWPSCDHRLINGWVVMQGAEGRSLFEHFVLPGNDTPDMSQDGISLFRKLIGITAFDYLFGMLDRNEDGIIFGRDVPMTAIDNEYLLTYGPIPAQGKCLLNHRLYLGQLGLDGELVTDDHAISDHLHDASMLFERAGKKLDEIVEIVGEHSAQNPYVDCTIFRVELGQETIGNIRSRIAAGVNAFRDRLLEEMAEIRSLGMFQCP